MASTSLQRKCASRLSSPFRKYAVADWYTLTCVSRVSCSMAQDQRLLISGRATLAVQPARNLAETACSRTPYSAPIRRDLQIVWPLISCIRGASLYTTPPIEIPALRLHGRLRLTRVFGPVQADLLPGPCQNRPAAARGARQSPPASRAVFSSAARPRKSSLSSMPSCSSGLHMPPGPTFADRC